jgi:hypothetical protein
MVEKCDNCLGDNARLVYDGHTMVMRDDKGRLVSVYNRLALCPACHDSPLLPGYTIDPLYGCEHAPEVVDALQRKGAQ